MLEEIPYLLKVDGVKLKIANALEALSDDQIVIRFDWVNKLVERFQHQDNTAHHDYGDHLARCNGLFEIFYHQDIPLNTDTLVVLIFYLNLEMAKRGRKRFD